MSQGPDEAAPVRAGLLRWLPAIAITAAMAIAVTLVIRSNELLDGERTLTRWFSDLDVIGIRSLVDVLDFISRDEIAPVVFVVIFPIAWRTWGRYAALTYIATGGITALTRITDLASRPRPTEDLQWTEAVFGAGGYPSGHVIYAVLVFGILAYLAGRYMTPGRPRTALRVLLVMLVVTMGPARVINLDHWAGDVIGSYLLALPFLLTAIWLHPRLPGWLSGLPRIRKLIGADREV
ncbi:MAG: phosphatase PAP2 family protein [Dehalococcoidia bacterium]|nr:phosphatase PAP2 family protein [Dehalococcoidia bacterium]